MTHKQDRRNFLKNGIALGTGLAIGHAGSTLAGTGRSEEMSIFDVFKKRRSVRKFKSTPVPDAHIKQILDAAHSAPSPRNRQAWKFVVIQNRDTLNRIKEACIKVSGDTSRQYFEDYLSAPVYVVILADIKTRNPENDIIAGALAAQNLFLAARALGYGTVYCANSIPEEVTKEILSIPDNYKRICITPIGIPDAWPETPPKKNLEEVVAYEKL